MTIDDLHIEFRIAVDKLDTSITPEMGDEVVDRILNITQDEFIKTRYGINNLYKAGFEAIQKRTDDLRALVQTETLNTNIVVGETNAVRVDLTTTAFPYMFFLRGRTTLTKTGCPDQLVGIKLIKQDSIERVLIDPFNKPAFGENQIAYFESDGLHILTDGTYSVPSFRLTYLKRPVQMDRGSYGNAVVQCEMSEHTHREIVKMAVSWTLENIESVRNGSIKHELNTIE